MPDFPGTEERFLYCRKSEEKAQKCEIYRGNDASCYKLTHGVVLGSDAGDVHGDYQRGADDGGNEQLQIAQHKNGTDHAAGVTACFDIEKLIQDYHQNSAEQIFEKNKL